MRIACSVASKRLQVPVSREQFEQLSLPLLERTRSTVNLVLNRLGRTPQDVGRVLLGGRFHADAHRPAGTAGANVSPAGRRHDPSGRVRRWPSASGLSETARQSLASLPRRPTGKYPASQPQPDGHVGPRHHGSQLGYRGAQGWHSQDEHHPSGAPPIPRPRERAATTRPHADGQESLIVPVLQGESEDPRLNQLLAPATSSRGFPAPQSSRRWKSTSATTPAAWWKSRRGM